MVSAKTDSQSQQSRVLVPRADQRHHLLQQIRLELDVPSDALTRWYVAVVPALFVHRIHAEDLQLTGPNFFPDRRDHSPVFEVIEPPTRSREHKNRLSR